MSVNVKGLVSNTALGHLVVSALIVGVGAVISAILNDPSLTNALVSVGLPLSVAKFIVDALRSTVPTL